MKIIAVILVCMAAWDLLGSSRIILKYLYFPSARLIYLMYSKKFPSMVIQLMGDALLIIFLAMWWR